MRYHSGQMPAAEMHRLERAALEDPFLADALEGYGQDAQAAMHVEALHQRLDVRSVPAAKLVRFNTGRWVAAAAAVTILVISGYFINKQLTEPAGDKPIVSQTEVRAAGTPAETSAATALDAIIQADSAHTCLLYTSPSPRD